jgi:hypothetical protein
MAISNLFNSLSKFSISSIIWNYLYDNNPSTIFLNSHPYQLYPLGLNDGITFYHHICANLFENT